MKSLIIMPSLTFAHDKQAPQVRMPPHHPSRLSLLLLASATLLSSASASSSSFSRARWVGHVRGGGGGGAGEGVESFPPSQITPGLDKKGFTLLKEADLYRGKWYVRK